MPVCWLVGVQQGPVQTRGDWNTAGNKTVTCVYLGLIRWAAASTAHQERVSGMHFRYPARDPIRLLINDRCVLTSEQLPGTQYVRSTLANFMRLVVCVLRFNLIQHSKKLARVGGRDSNVLPNGTVTC
jgi:hypothetical protein